jgi:hypothetical protein
MEKYPVKERLKIDFNWIIDLKNYGKKGKGN